MKNQTLADVSTGPDWVLPVIILIFALLSILLLSGKGGWLIAGYNTAPKEEKENYNEKRLCRICGAGMAAVTGLMVIMEVFEDRLPASSAHAFGAAVVVICVIMVVLGNTAGRNKKG